MVTISHPEIGVVRGIAGDGYASFLGVQYARLEHRFAPAELVTYKGEGLEATRYGPQVPSPIDGVDFEHAHIQHSLDKPDFPGRSDTEGLHLNVTCPTLAGPEKNLPVLVFIPGGGFYLGSNWYPEFNLGSLVRLSGKCGIPIIGVCINYRLGLPGLLYSEEMHNLGCQSNNALRDQRVALQWVKENINGFGGNPDNITVMGQSVGGFSSAMLLCSVEPLCRRIIALGGSIPLLRPVSFKQADTIYEAVVEHFGLTHLSPFEKLKALIDLSPQELVEDFPISLRVAPIIDAEIIPSEPTFQSISDGSFSMPGKTWCEKILVGYTKLDGSIGATSLRARKEGIRSAFALSLHKYMSPQAVDTILQEYGITKTATDEQAYLNILRLSTDLWYQAPAYGIADRFPDRTSALHFNEPNPWEGPFQGEATHILDVAFAFQNYNEYLPEDQRANAIRFGKHIISFTNNRPLNDSESSSDDEEPVLVTYEKGVSTVERLKKGMLKDSSKLAAVGKRSRTTLDTLLAAWEDFLFTGQDIHTNLGAESSVSVNR